MISIEAEFTDAGTMAEVIRLALGGDTTAAGKIADAPAKQTPQIEAPDAEEAPAKRHPNKKPVSLAPAATKYPEPNAGRGRAPAEAGDGTVQGAVLEALRAKPMSSIELQEALHKDPQAIHSATYILKNKGLIESVIDGLDETRRYKLRG